MKSIHFLLPRFYAMRGHLGHWYVPLSLYHKHFGVFVKTNIGIWFSYPENYIDFVQSKGRLDRTGQTKQPVFYYLEIAGSVEPQIYKTLLSGQNFDQRLFEKWLDEGGK